MQIVLPTVFVILFSVVTRTLAIQCYICGPGAQQPFKKTQITTTAGNGDAGGGGFGGNSPNNRGHGGYTDGQVSAAGITNANAVNSIATSCENFEKKSDSLQEFIMECPSFYSGCITEIEGGRTTRTCESLNINDCKIANNITYCYCNTDLCNGEKVSILTSRAWKHKDPMENYDDEDFLESSGMNENAYGKRKNRINSVIDDSEKSSGSRKSRAINHILLGSLIYAACAHFLFAYIPNSLTNKF